MCSNRAPPFSMDTPSLLSISVLPRYARVRMLLARLGKIKKHHQNQQRLSYRSPRKSELIHSKSIFMHRALLSTLASSTRLRAYTWVSPFNGFMVSLFNVSIHHASSQTRQSFTSVSRPSASGLLNAVEDRPRSRMDVLPVSFFHLRIHTSILSRLTCKHCVSHHTL